MKGIFTQGVVILTERPVELDELRPFLPEYPFLRTVEANKEWVFGGPTAVVDYRREVNGLAAIDTIDRQWPDGMGDSKKETMLFGAWAMGNFGPFAYPNGLLRATQQAWSWPEAKTTVPRHRGFLRLRTSYVFGAGPDAKILPPNYDPRHELDFLVELAQCILKHPAALCYFNPSGEVVASAKRVEDSIVFHRKHNLPPFDLWSNVRLFNLTADWLMMDTVGCWQLDIPDHEAAFPKEKFTPDDVSSFLRNAALYVLNKGREIKDNDTMDGPRNTRWQAVRFADPISDPPRQVFCWIPIGSQTIPAQVTNRKPATPDEPSPKK
jgi:hypothetical protein